VQLDSQHTLSLALPPSIQLDVASTSKVFALIEDEESKYQNALNDTYHDMGENTFKGLRRALPLTRQKLDWDKVCNAACDLFAGCWQAHAVRRFLGTNSAQNCRHTKADNERRTFESMHARTICLCILAKECPSSRIVQCGNIAAPKLSCR
jgi:hypothetical protein